MTDENFARLLGISIVEDLDPDVWGPQATHDGLRWTFQHTWPPGRDLAFFTRGQDESLAFAVATAYQSAADKMWSDRNNEQE